MDLDYPKHLFEHHRDQPLAPEMIDIRKDMLSDSTQEFLEEHGIRFNTQKRLAPSFLPKRNYVVHIENLKFYIEQGLVLKKVHRGVCFYQSRFLKEYIDLNTQKRV